MKYINVKQNPFLTPGSTEGEQTEKSPSDEGFTELEPTVNGSTEEAEGTSSTALGTVGRDHHYIVGPSGPSQETVQNKQMLGQTKGKQDDEEDEGVAQNSSIEDGESMQSSLETEEQGGVHDKPESQEVTKTKDVKSEGPEELLNGVDDDIMKKLSLKEASEVRGRSALERQSPDKPAEGDELSEEEKRKKNYEAEMKSWFLERMQAPIKGTDYTL